MPPLIATLTLNPALDITTAAERVVPTHKIRCAAPRYDPGGGGINVARVATRIGVNAVALFPSGGAIGDQLQQLLKAEKVPVSSVPVEGRTRESFVVDEEESGLQFRFVLPGPSLPAEAQELILDRLRALPRSPACIVVSGSLPPGVRPDFFERLRALSAEHRALLLLDMPGERLHECAGPGVFLIKPNLRELEAACGQELRSERDESRAARQLVQLGLAEVVLVSLGARGALLATAQETHRLPSLPVQACSAVGAGDSMVAGIAAGLANGFPLLDAARLGVAAGAAALITPGTELARLEDIERLYGALAVPDTGEERGLRGGARA